MIYRFLALFLAFSFTLPNISNNYSIISTSHAFNCPEGMQKHPDQEKCIYTRRTLEKDRQNKRIREQSDRCNSLEGEEKARCLERIAKNETSSIKNELPENFEEAFLAGTGINIEDKERQIAMQVMNGLMLFYIAARSPLTENCLSPSFHLLMSSGRATIAGELAASLYYKIAMQGVAREYKKDIDQNQARRSNNSNSSSTVASNNQNTDDPQIRAFDHLIDQEGIRLTTALVRGGTYSLASLLSNLGALYALSEIATEQIDNQAKAAYTCANPTAAASYRAGTYGTLVALNFIDRNDLNTELKYDQKSLNRENEEEAGQNNNVEGDNPDNPRDRSDASALPIDSQVNYITPNKLKHKLYSSAKNNDNNKTVEDIFYEFRNGWIDHVGYELASGVGYHLPFSQVTPEEINEITLRSIVNLIGINFTNLIFPSAHAEEEINEDFEGFIDTTVDVVNTTGDFIGDGTNAIVEIGKELLAPLKHMQTSNTVGLVTMFEGVGTGLEITLLKADGRTALGGTMGVYSGFMAGFSFMAAYNSSKRIQAIEEVRNQYAGADPNGLDPCGGSRDDPSKPSCFCYLSDGARNYARSNSNACLDKWGESEVMASVNYAQQATGTEAPKGCITNKGEFDRACSCRYAKDSEKKCQTISGNLNFGDVGSNSFLKGATEAANAITNGSISGADVAAGRMHKSAVAASKLLNEKLKNDPKFKNIRDQIAKTRKQFRDFNNKMLKQAAANISSPKALSAGSGTITPTVIANPTDALEAAKESVKKESNLKFSSGTGAKTTGGSSGNNMDLDFGTTGEIVTQGNPNDLSDITDGDYIFKGDIHKDPSNNLFDILSLRYKRSALRRLFDDLGASRADDPAKTDINKK